MLPVGGIADQELRLIERREDGPRVLRSVPVRFVPLVGEEGYDGPR